MGKFGECCQHYLKVEDILRVMEFCPVKDQRHDFSAILCAQVIWAVIEDLRQFFHTTLHPDDFVSGAAPRFPTSILAWVNQSIAMQSPIPMSPRFPKRWDVAAATRDQARRQQLPWGKAATGEMWQDAASAMWGAQQPPPAPTASFNIPTPAQSAPQ